MILNMINTKLILIINIAQNVRDFFAKKSKVGKRVLFCLVSGIREGNSSGSHWRAKGKPGNLE